MWDSGKFGSQNYTRACAWRRATAATLARGLVQASSYFTILENESGPNPVTARTRSSFLQTVVLRLFLYVSPVRSITVGTVMLWALDRVRGRALRRRSGPCSLANLGFVSSADVEVISVTNANPSSIMMLGRVARRAATRGVLGARVAVVAAATAATGRRGYSGGGGARARKPFGWCNRWKLGGAATVTAGLSAALSVNALPPPRTRPRRDPTFLWRPSPHHSAIGAMIRTSCGLWFVALITSSSSSVLSGGRCALVHARATRPRRSATAHRPSRRGWRWSSSR